MKYWPRGRELVRPEQGTAGMDEREERGRVWSVVGILPAVDI